MKRIVMFSPGHGELGGAARRSSLIAAQLAASGWKVTVLTRAGTFSRFRMVREPNLWVLEVPGFNRPRLGAALYLALAIPFGFLAGIRARGIIAIQLMSTATAAGLCALLLRCPLIAMSTTSGKLGEVAYISGTRTVGTRVRLLRRASWIVAQTDTVALELRALTGSERVVVVPNPVRATTPAPLRGEPTVLFTGRLSAEKDLLGLLDAWEIVLQEEPDARLTLAGSGGEYRSVEAEVRARVESSDGLRSSVELPGWVNAVDPLLAAHDIFVLPSLEEGMSNALLEAVAAGRIVVASDIGPNRAVLGDDYTLVFAAGDHAALAATLLRALRLGPGERREVRLALEARVQLFSPEAVIARLEELIDAADHTRH